MHADARECVARDFEALPNYAVSAIALDLSEEPPAKTPERPKAPEPGGVLECLEARSPENAACELEALVAEPTKSHTYNCGYGRGFSVNQVLDAVDRVTNMTIERRYEGRRAGDPAALIADNRAILAALPWRPARDDLDTIVTDALAWERKLGERQA